MHHTDDMPGTCDYINVPGYIGLIVSEKQATLLELDTQYGAEDAYNLLEIIIVNRHNARIYANSDR